MRKKERLLTLPDDVKFIHGSYGVAHSKTKYYIICENTIDHWWEECTKKKYNEQYNFFKNL